jgi:hypothetical protein
MKSNVGLKLHRLGKFWGFSSRGRLGARLLRVSVTPRRAGRESSYVFF